VAGVGGPRQSGKTTLVRSVFPGRSHANLGSIACHLLGPASSEQLLRHPGRGGLFENWLLLEFLQR
jgi:hypothetical protein